MFTIDSKTFVFANEVDGYDPDTSETVEVKARKEKPTKMEDLMQIILNGSSRIVNFRTSKDGTHLESSVTYSRDEILNLNEENWIYTGQRIKYLIRHILACSTVKKQVQTHFSLPLTKPRSHSLHQLLTATLLSLLTILNF